MIVPTGSKLEKLSSRIEGGLVRAFETSPEPADFLESNRNAAITTAHAMGVDISGVDFTKFPEWNADRLSFFNQKIWC